MEVLHVAPGDEMGDERKARTKLRSCETAKASNGEYGRIERWKKSRQKWRREKKSGGLVASGSQ